MKRLGLGQRLKSMFDASAVLDAMQSVVDAMCRACSSAELAADLAGTVDVGGSVGPLQVA